jgi:PD-(D/E)XK nuclease superfamily protein
MKRYSPSRTEDWLKCPLYRHLKKEWTPRRIGTREMAAMLGKGFHAAMSAYNSQRRTGRPIGQGPVSDGGASVPYVPIAIQSIRMELQQAKERGCWVDERDKVTEDALERRVTKAVERYIAEDPIPESWVVLDVERILPEWGDCIIDLAMDTPMGVVVIDYKTKLTWDAKYRDSDLTDYRDSEQRFHYSVAYADFIKRPVYAFYVCLVVLEPTFHVYLEPFLNEQESLDIWRQGRENATWRVMEMEENGEIGVGRAAIHRTRFGYCDFYKACFEHKLDHQLMGRDYLATS